MQESNRVEYKRTLTDKLEREVVAFLNYKEGGVIYIGVDDDGTIVGVSDADILQRQIADRIKNNIQPATLGLYDVVVEDVQGKDVIKIILSSGNEKPYFLRSKGMSEAGCFIRVGSCVQPMPQEMIQHLFARRTRNSLGNILSPRSGLSFEQLKIYYQERGFNLNANFRQTLELLTKDGELNYVAYLLADENGTSIKVAKYAGTTKVDLVENEEYGYCSLIKATERVLDKFNIENITRVKITAKTRQEQRLVNPVALREAIVNAIVHNDYTSSVPPVFEIFSDRFEITSYGGLIDGLSKEEFFGCCSKPRNRELMRIYKDLQFVEQLGSGMGRILTFYDTSIFQFSQNFMKVIFRFPKLEKNVTKMSPKCHQKMSPKNVTKKEEEVYRRLKENETMTVRQLALKLDVNQRTIIRALESLKLQGRLVREGPSNGGRWVLK